eukprot:364659-Prorocentrum_minimum.AAC.2
MSASRARRSVTCPPHPRRPPTPPAPSLRSAQCIALVYRLGALIIHPLYYPPPLIVRLNPNPYDAAPLRMSLTYVPYVYNIRLLRIYA